MCVIVQPARTHAPDERQVQAMGLQDTMSKAVQAVSRTVSKNRSTIENGIDKAADAASRRSGGKYDDAIRRGTEKARSTLDKVGTQSSGHDDTPPQGYPTTPRGAGGTTGSPRGPAASPGEAGPRPPAAGSGAKRQSPQTPPAAPQQPT